MRYLDLLDLLSNLPLGPSVFAACTTKEALTVSPLSAAPRTSPVLQTQKRHWGLNFPSSS